MRLIRNILLGITGNNSFSEQYLNEENEGQDLDLPLFDLGTITDATGNFSIDNKLGEGGFGPVYKVCNSRSICLHLAIAYLSKILKDGKKKIR